MGVRRRALAPCADLGCPLGPRPPAACSETYEYYSLPYCKPSGGVKWKTLGMGEVVDANRMASTPYLLNFNKERTNELVCEKQLSSEELQKFRKVSRGRSRSARRWWRGAGGM